MEAIIDALGSRPDPSGVGPDLTHLWLERAEASARQALERMGTSGADLFVDSLRHWWPDLWEGLQLPYADHPDRDDQLARLIVVLAERWQDRPEPLRALDARRIVQPDWFQVPGMVGYVFYVDRFAGSIRGIERHLDHLDTMGIRYVHLMPVLRTRDGDNDGGYAVADYRAIDPRLGTMDDLERVCGLLRERGISVCIDLVLNHCAAEHAWAQAALAGDRDHEAFFRIYPDRAMPDAFEATLPEVFPDFAPGNFTRLADGRWVWTTFNRFQWDLDWSNPRVFVEMVDILLELANRGVDVFRLDAVAFMWKRLGTDCQNQPEVHSILRALRACARIAAPAVAFKAEAIVGPDDLAPYLGSGIHEGRECDLAYHNSLMVQFWSALATRDTRLMTSVLSGLPRKPPTTAWATYIRCHDDIGWAITDADAGAVGWSGPGHRAFLSEFYAGRFPGTFAVGEVFQHNPATGDSRISGTFASLAGLEQALLDHDPVGIDRAIARILAGHALICGWDGIPLLYMGDEIGLCNDAGFRLDPRLASDNRWMHRPRMDWDRATAALDPRSVPGRLFHGICRLVATRRDLPQLHAAAPLDVVDVGDARLFAFVRGHRSAPLLAIHNLTDMPSVMDAGVLGALGLARALDALEPQETFDAGRPVILAPYATRWLVTAGDPLQDGSDGGGTQSAGTAW